MKFARISERADSTICRDRPDTKAILEIVRRIAGIGAEAGARKYALWKRDLYHASLHFEERRNGICVVRIGDHYRALGLRADETIAWFWIGTHEEYNRFRF